MLDLDFSRRFDPTRDADFFAEIPARPGVYLLEPIAPNAQPYIARTADLRRAAHRLLAPSDAQSRRLNLREVIGGIRYRVTGSKFEQLLTLYHQARFYFPKRYRDFMRLRPPALLKVNLRNDYPRCYVTRRLLADGGLYLGPFASRRSAASFSDSLLDLFKTRRCQIKIRRDPAFPGCIYSEMKMCLAPCFAGCSHEEYAAEVARLVAALTTAGSSLEQTLEQEREAASAALDFERAAAVHKKIEKVAGVLRGLPELARPIEQLDAVILQRGGEKNCVMVFSIHAGQIAGTFPLRFAELSSEPRSLDSILRACLEPAGDASVTVAQASHSVPSAEPAGSALPLAPDPPASSPDALKIPAATPVPQVPARPATSSERAEHLALIARWFYSKPRQGEILFRDNTWPYRRMVRACSRVLAATPPPPPVPEN
jgi:excinuclease UvrABC nuclease subunit